MNASYPPPEYRLSFRHLSFRHCGIESSGDLQKKKKKKAVKIPYKGVSSTRLLSGQEESTVKF